MWHRNPDVDLQQARRLAIVNGGEDMQKYFSMLWRIYPRRATDEAYRLEEQNISAFEAYVDFVIQIGELDEGSRADALSYMRRQRFAWLFDPTPIDQVRENFPNHEDVCHGDDYPGHCCLENLIETYSRTEKAYVILCRRCQEEGGEILLGGYNPDNQEDSVKGWLEWADDNPHILPCAWQRDEDEFDWYRRNPPGPHAQDIGDQIANLRKQLGLTIPEFSKIVTRYYKSPSADVTIRGLLKKYEAGETACGTIILLQRMKRVADHHKIPFKIRKEWLPLAAQQRYPEAFTLDGWLKGTSRLTPKRGVARRRSRPRFFRNPEPLVEPNDKDLVIHLFELQQLVNSNPHWHNWVRILEHAQKTGADVFIEHPEYPPVLMLLKSVSRGGRVAAGYAVAIHPHRHELDNEITIRPWKLKNCRAHLKVYSPEERAQKREDYWHHRIKEAIRKMIYGKDVIEDAMDIKEYRNLYYSKIWTGTQYPT
jgi:hypothetical protein